MDNKSVSKSVQLSEEERSKLLELKEQYGITWDEFIEYANRVLSEDMEDGEAEREAIGFSPWDVE